MSLISWSRSKILLAAANCSRLSTPSSYQRQLEVASAKAVVAEAAYKTAEADLAVLTQELPKRVQIAERRLEIAREEESKARDSLKMITRDVDQGILASEASVVRMQSVLTLAQEDFQRYKDLFNDGSGTQRRYQEATRALGTAKADVNEAQARLEQSRARQQQIDIAKRQVQATTHAVAEAEASLELAKLGALKIEAARRLMLERQSAVAEAKSAVQRAETTLGYAKVVAPKDGIIAKKWRHPRRLCPRRRANHQHVQS